MQLYKAHGITVTVGPCHDLRVEVEDPAQISADGGLVLVRPNFPRLVGADVPEGDQAVLLDQMMHLVVTANPGTDLRRSGGAGQVEQIAIYGPEEMRARVVSLAGRLLAALKEDE